MYLNNKILFVGFIHVHVMPLVSLRGLYIWTSFYLQWLQPCHLWIYAAYIYGHDCSHATCEFTRFTCMDILFFFFCNDLQLYPICVFFIVLYLFMKYRYQRQDIGWVFFFKWGWEKGGSSKRWAGVGGNQTSPEVNV